MQVAKDFLEEVQELVASKIIIETFDEIEEGDSRKEVPRKTLDVFIQSGLVKSRTSFRKNPMLLRVDGLKVDPASDWPQEINEAVLIAGKNNPRYCHVISDVKLCDLLEDVAKRRAEVT